MAAASRFFPAKATEVMLNCIGPRCRPLHQFRPHLPDGGEVLSPVSVMQSGKWGRNWWRGRHRGPMQFSITSVAFAGKNLLAAAMDRTGGIRLWDLRSSRILGD